MHIWKTGKLKLNQECTTSTQTPTPSPWSSISRTQRNLLQLFVAAIQFSQDHFTHGRVTSLLCYGDWFSERRGESDRNDGGYTFHVGRWVESGYGGGHTSRLVSHAARRWLSRGVLDLVGRWFRDRIRLVVQVWRRWFWKLWIVNILSNKCTLSVASFSRIGFTHYTQGYDTSTIYLYW